MSRHGKKRKKTAPAIENVELNIMPFIDIFSLLNTFLLFTATFVSIGLLKVQVPFFSNATPDKKPARSLSIDVEVDTSNVTLSTKYSSPPLEPTKSSFAMTDEGIAAFHNAMLFIKKENPKEELVTLYSSDDLPYNKLVQILDAVKVDSSVSNEEEGIQDNNTLFPKVVIGSVLL